MLDYDPASGSVGTCSAERLLAAAQERNWTIELVLETHTHADHLSAAAFFKANSGARIGIGAGIRDVQTRFSPVFAAADLKPEGGDFDLLLEDGDELPLGALCIPVIATPGHTSADVSYRIGDNIFVGDTLFMPDSGTARADFPGGDARALYRSMRRLLSLSPHTRLYMCHDYKAPGRDDYRWQASVAEQQATNIQVGGQIGEEDFVRLREARDATLSTPKLLLPSIQVNMRGGRLPPSEANGLTYLKIPVKIRDGAQLN